MKRRLLTTGLMGAVIVAAALVIYILGTGDEISGGMNDPVMGDFSLVAADDRVELTLDNPFQDGEIRYLYDDFSGYQKYSLSIDSFENNVDLRINGQAISAVKSEDNYGGDWSVQIEVSPEGTTEGKLQLQREIPTLDLSRWNEAGVFSAWIRLENPSGVSAISLKLVDQKGNVRSFRKLENYLGPEENEIKQNDPHHDYYLPESILFSGWEDYMFSKGWNFLFWPSNEFKEPSEFDMSQVSGYELIIYTNAEFRKQVVRLDNLRVSDGLQKEKNPTNGAWFAPNGMPQFGVWDIDDDKIRLMNVRQTQYPSNGDHTRLLSRKNVPENFRMRMLFKLEKLEEVNWLQRHSQRGIKQPNENTWIRIAYDFEHQYDAGHDWFGVFMSLEYEKFGLVTVSPKERYFQQVEEPNGDSYTRKNRMDFRPTEDTLYLIDLTVQGQHNVSNLYEVRDDGGLQEIGRVEYTFKRNRPEERFPLSIEATGNVHLEIYQIELLSLEAPFEMAELEVEDSGVFSMLGG